MRFHRHARGPERRFAATEDRFAQEGILRSGEVGASRSLLVEAAPMAKLALDILRKDPRYLLA
jgi:hypothetical protein